MASVKAYTVTKKGVKDRMIRLDSDGVKKWKKDGYSVNAVTYGKAKGKPEGDTK